MKSQPVVVIFDVGKTNKKILLFDEDYHVLFEESTQFKEVLDEDGFPCENVWALTEWIKHSFSEILADKRFDVRAINFSSYGASFVCVDRDLKPLLPLYNYLKPFPKTLQDQFYNTYGGEETFSLQTASPVLGSLNSGMQLYRLKFERPEIFSQIGYALHLSQYLSSVLTVKVYSEITSIGCHTNLWDFSRNDYHEWVSKEDITLKFPPILSSDECLQIKFENRIINAGIGLHDSSAALIPYLANFPEPFVLLSTGTWCISLNPFNESYLTKYELENDCLCYLTAQGTPVKASRLFAGYEHEQQSKRLADYYGIPVNDLTGLSFDGQLIKKLKRHAMEKEIQVYSLFSERDPSEFGSSAEAYHALITDIVTRQVASTNLVLRGNDAKRIFVDGGFSKNSIYMNLIAAAFPRMKVYAASVAQASALGAALAIHKHWNKKPVPSNLIELKFYADPTERSGSNGEEK
jgi:sugar (pentulose or hexulose) kinase